MSSVWTPELREKVVELYQEANPTEETTVEIVKQIAEEIEQSANGVRMVLVQAGVYLKKSATAAKPTKDSSEGSGTKRVSKESQIEALKAAIENVGSEVDEEILGKLTGKAAAYFTSILTKK